MPARHSYACFDFHLRSEVALVELGPDTEAGDRPIVAIRLGRVPERLPDAAPALWGLQATASEALLTVKGVARYLVRGGREIVVEPAPDGSERDLRLFLLGSSLGIVCHQRGLLPLHANAIVANGGACAFAGVSGAGKSTLAAHFSNRGYEVLCDDVCAVSFDEAGNPFAWPGLPRVKLWGDAALAFGHDSATLERVIEGNDKYHVPLPAVRETRPVPLRRLYLLDRREEGAKSGINPLLGHRAMEAAMSHTYRGCYLGPMGLAARHFRQCAMLAERIDAYEARRAWGYDVFDEEAGLLEQHILDQAGQAATASPLRPPATSPIPRPTDAGGGFFE